MGCDIYIVTEVRTQAGAWLLYPAAIPSYRDYLTFAVLANVRNRDGITPISEPKGLPEDMSNGLASLLEGRDFYLGDHSFSWLTGLELLGYPLYEEIVLERMVTAETAKDYRTTGALPQEWCSATNAPGWEPLQWSVPLSRYARLLCDIKEALQGIRLGGAYPYEAARRRVVFGFDS